MDGQKVAAYDKLDTVHLFSQVAKKNILMVIARYILFAVVETFCYTFMHTGRGKCPDFVLIKR